MEKSRWLQRHKRWDEVVWYFSSRHNNIIGYISSKISIGRKPRIPGYYGGIWDHGFSMDQCKDPLWVEDPSGFAKSTSSIELAQSYGLGFNGSTEPIFLKDSKSLLLWVWMKLMMLLEFVV
jgi:hypothetical protein